MFSDLLVLPIIMIVSVGLKYLLNLVGIRNGIVLLSCLFLGFHLALTGLMWLQISSKALVDQPHLSRFETIAFAAVISSLVALGTYIIIGLAPAFKIPFFFLKPLPLSQYWADLFIVAIPTFLAHVGGRLVAQSLMA